MRNTYNPLVAVLEDHYKFLLITADVISHSITESQWTRIKSLLSPESRFTIPDALNFSTIIIPKTKCIPNKVIWYEKRQTLVFHLTYDFHSYEGASCTEFFMRGPRSLLPLPIDLVGVTHQISVPNIKDTEISHIYGVVTVEKAETADTYSKLISMPWLQTLLADRNYYATINKSILTEILYD
jgi:hypothetical protein